MRADPPVILGWLVAMRTNAACNDPHQEYDLLLFDDPSISGVIKEFVKVGQRIRDGSGLK
jgi:hypothetical protein